MSIEFHKMHGAGNDFVLVDARSQDFQVGPALAARIADRHRGIGCDQILVLRDARDTRHVLRYEIWNSDGSPAAQCGNGARCVGLFVELDGHSGGGDFSVESPSGVVTMHRCRDGEYRLDMGVPDFDAAHIRPALEMHEGLYRLDSPWGPLAFGTVSMGNPHALVPCDDINSEDIPAIGHFISTHPAFPEGVNAGFAQLEGRAKIHLRVVERGAGETLACGSGACAAVAVLQRLGRVDDSVDVFLPGGHLVIQWPGSRQTLTMKGPAVHVFRGIMNE